MAEDDGDWENFSVPTFGAPTASVGSSFVVPKASYADDEEEDLTLKELAEAKLKISVPSAAQVEAHRKKAQLEEETLANKLEYALQESETAEEKKLRERRQQEESDLRILAQDMGVDTPSSRGGGGGSVVSGVAGIALKTKQDHVNFAITVANKLSPSTQICCSAFAAELIGRIKGNISPEGLDSLIAVLTAARATRVTVQAVSTKKSKKELKKETKKQEDIFGGLDDSALALEDQYAAMEDDSFF